MGGCTLSHSCFTVNCDSLIDRISHFNVALESTVTTVMVPLLEAFFARDLLAIPASTWGACGLALAGILVMGMEFPFGAQEQMEIMAASSTETLDQAAAFVSNNAGSTFDTAAVMESTLTLDPSAVVVESVQSVMEASSSFSWEFLLQGDTLIVGAAALYAMQILRISRWTAEYTPLQIMTGKTMGEAFFSLLFLGSTVGLTNSGIVDSTNTNPALSFLQTSGNQAIEFYTTVTARLSEGSMSLDTIEHFVGATLWTGLVSTCYVVFAQSYGQKLVKASDANLIYSLQPLFTAIFAYWMLGETLQPMGFFGGALIGAGVYTVATKSLAATEKA
jgi:drug/metabolite transporter (DMT)-like permease